MNPDQTASLGWVRVNGSINFGIFVCDIDHMVTVIGRWGTTSMIISVYTVLYACFEKKTLHILLSSWMSVFASQNMSIFLKTGKNSVNLDYQTCCTHKSKGHNSSIGDISDRGKKLPSYFMRNEQMKFQDPISRQTLLRFSPRSIKIDVYSTM